MSANNVLCKILGHRWKRGWCARCKDTHKEHEWEVDKVCRSNVICKVCGFPDSIVHALERENNNGWTIDLNSVTDNYIIRMIAIGGPAAYRESDWKTAVNLLNDQKTLAQIFVDSRFTEYSQARLVASKITDPDILMDLYGKGKFPEAVNENFLVVKQQFLNGKSQKKLADIAENEYNLVKRLIALEKLDDQTIIERIAKTGRGRECEQGRLSRMIEIRVLAITRLESVAAVERVFSDYQIGEERNTDYKLPLFKSLLRKMASFYMKGQDVPYDEIAIAVCRAVQHDSHNVKQWKKDVQKLKDILSKYRILLNPVMDQIRSKVSEHIIYSNAKMYGEGDDAFVISGDEVNIGIDIDDTGDDRNDFGSEW